MQAALESTRVYPTSRPSAPQMLGSTYGTSSPATCAPVAPCAARRPPGSQTARGARPGILNISQRPAEATDRAVPGHWEGDLIFGRGMSPVATLVERSTRYLMLIGRPAGHRAELVADALAEAITTLPRRMTRSLTWDQGHEMAEYARFTVATGIAVYFCDPKVPGSAAATRAPTACSASTCPATSASGTTPKPTSTPSSPNSTADLDKPSPSRHHPKHSTRRCDDRLSPQPRSSPARTTECFPRQWNVRLFDRRIVCEIGPES